MPGCSTILQETKLHTLEESSEALSQILGDNKLKPIDENHNRDATITKHVFEWHTLRPKTTLRSKSYNNALRKSIYINCLNDEARYSFWNQAYSSLEKRNTCIENEIKVSHTNVNFAARRINSV